MFRGMNSKQRQFILLTWLMAMLCIVLVFLLTYASESPLNNQDQNNITGEDPVEDKEIKRGFQLPGIFGVAYNGLVELSEDFKEGLAAISSEEKDSG
ncbi:MAG: K+-transporting ATPase A subunit [Candidatus Nanohaloarchaea archaeon]|jgi:K+-transporting ATPase A subunit